MRGYVPTQDRARLPGWMGLGLIAFGLVSLAQGQTGSGPDTDLTVSPIALAADRVRVWDEERSRFVLLEGRVLVEQGKTALRGTAAVVRIATESQGDRVVHRVAVHIEGEPAPSSTVTATPPPFQQVQWISKGEVRLRSYQQGGVTRLGQAPTDPPILSRAFPRTAAQPGVSENPLPSTRDAQVRPTQFEPEGFSGDLGGPMLDDPPPGLEGMPSRDPSPDLNAGAPSGLPSPLPGELVPPSELPQVAPGVEAPVLPESRRIINISPRDSNPGRAQDYRILPDGRIMIIIRGGVNITTEAPGQGIIDVTADSAVVWTQFGPANDQAPPPTGEKITQDLQVPLEIYLEGNVVFRQDQGKVAGPGDQLVVQARQFYIDVRQQKFVTLDAELDLFAPQLLTPIKTKAREIRQFRPLLGESGGRALYGPTQIRADEALLTGSRFPIPGYRFQSRSVDLTEQSSPLLGPDGRPIVNPKDPLAPSDQVWRVDARQNLFKIGPVPVFYWPRLVTDTDDLDPPLRMIQFRANNYFGQQFLTDWNMFKILGLKRPTFIDSWNLDVDYLSYRGVAVGTELGWAGRNLFDDLTDPYHRSKTGATVDRPYFGYFDVWGLRDLHVDVLGPGPAIVTNGPPGSGSAGFQRTADPAFQDNRGRFLLRHMQYLTGPDAPPDEEMRLQLEAAYLSDRNFLEQYYKRLFDTGLDQATLGYFIWQRQNSAFTILAQPNLQPWYTDTQWFPKADYYRLGQSFLNIFTYWSDTGIDYANVHTDVMVNNPNLFAFQPFDPVSATSGAFRTGRIWTSHELSLPLNLTYLRFTPYLQGQLVGWDNQYQSSLPPLTLNTVLPNTDYIRGPQGALLGRGWAGVGARLNMMASRIFPEVENDLLNVHGLAHKINFDVDFRATESNVSLSRIGVQDQLDDNTYEFVRRYFALINYSGGILPAQYDPRLLTLRRTISPITGTTDIQDELQTVKFSLNQRLQTKRGQIGQQRVVDWMTLDLTTTYFPNSQRDNFGEALGLTQYNYEWYVGDRTSIVSSGWFEFWDVTGNPLLFSTPRHTNSPFGLDVITTGISLARPPRGNVFLGYSVVNTGVIATSALNVAASYWLSPKWYGSFATSYDFGNAIPLGSTVGITRIGADFLTSIGLTVDPQRGSYMFGFELTPRLSPSLRFGSGGGIARFDPRFAPIQ